MMNDMAIKAIKLISIAIKLFEIETSYEKQAYKSKDGKILQKVDCEPNDPNELNQSLNLSESHAGGSFKKYLMKKAQKYQPDEYKNMSPEQAHKLMVQQTGSINENEQLKLERMKQAKLKSKEKKTDNDLDETKPCNATTRVYVNSKLKQFSNNSDIRDYLTDPADMNVLMVAKGVIEDILKQDGGGMKNMSQQNGGAIFNGFGSGFSEQYSVIKEFFKNRNETELDAMISQLKKLNSNIQENKQFQQLEADYKDVKSHFTNQSNQTNNQTIQTNNQSNNQSNQSTKVTKESTQNKTNKQNNQMGGEADASDKQIQNEFNIGPNHEKSNEQSKEQHDNQGLSDQKNKGYLFVGGSKKSKKIRRKSTKRKCYKKKSQRKLK